MQFYKRYLHRLYRPESPENVPIIEGVNIAQVLTPTSEALATGYRLGDCYAHRVKDLDRFGPSLPLAAEFCKNRKQARQPIARELCAKLLGVSAGKGPDESLLDMPKPHTAGAFRRVDFTAAGIASFIKDLG